MSKHFTMSCLLFLIVFKYTDMATKVAVYAKSRVSCSKEQQGGERLQLQHLHEQHWSWNKPKTSAH